MSPAIFMDIKGIIHFHDPSSCRKNLQSESYNSKNYSKLRYGKIAISVKWIDASDERPKGFCFQNSHDENRIVANFIATVP
jgi:hypothetical protein